jgi:hypothetical protein
VDLAVLGLLGDRRGLLQAHDVVDELELVAGELGKLKFLPHLLHLVVEVVRLVVLFDLLILEVHELQEELLALLREVPGFLLQHLVSIEDRPVLPLDQVVPVTKLGESLLDLFKPLLALVLLLDVLHQLPV